MAALFFSRSPMNFRSCFPSMNAKSPYIGPCSRMDEMATPGSSGGEKINDFRRARRIILKFRSPVRLDISSHGTNFRLIGRVREPSQFFRTAPRLPCRVTLIVHLGPPSSQNERCHGNSGWMEWRRREICDENEGRSVSGAFKHSSLELFQAIRLVERR